MALAACAGQSATEGRSTPPRPIAGPPASAQPPPNGAPLAKLPPASRSRKRDSVDDDPNQIVGLFAPEVAILLGRPVTVRREVGAEIWQYRRADCIFDLFLYREDGEPMPRVTYFELRAARGASLLSEQDGRSCFSGLVLDELDGSA